MVLEKSSFELSNDFWVVLLHELIEFSSVMNKSLVGLIGLCESMEQVRRFVYEERWLLSFVVFNYFLGFFNEFIIPELVLHSREY